MILVTKQQAVSDGLSKYFTGKPCKYGHISERRTVDSHCCECFRIKNAVYYAANKDAQRARGRKWAEANPEKVVEIKRRLDQDLVRASRRKWANANKPIINYHNRRRQAHSLLATPLWADTSKMVALYQEAASLTVSTGVKHVVDHVIPLRGRHVCGLHVETNMQVIPEADNLTKANKFERL